MSMFKKDSDRKGVVTSEDDRMLYVLLSKLISELKLSHCSLRSKAREWVSEQHPSATEEALKVSSGNILSALKSGKITFRYLIAYLRLLKMTKVTLSLKCETDRGEKFVVNHVCIFKKTTEREETDGDVQPRKRVTRGKK